MNSLAVFFGLLYGVATAVASYAVSMVMSGLFARAFYRIYARVLIGICSAMLLVPLLRWVSPHPFAARLLLTATDYVTFSVLGYGVIRFNREFMQTVFLSKRLTAYFTFGTLAYATLVTTISLHIATAAKSGPAGSAFSLVGAEHYGPFVMLLAAIIFHTDYHLKKSTRDNRLFSRFTFIGYAVSFLALAISTLPYFGGAFTALGLSGPSSQAERTFLENFSCAQTLLLAIAMYAALVWHLSSIPPLYLLLLAICGEYHVLVTQWVVAKCGAASWGLASFPLFVGLSTLTHFFMRWDRKRAEREARAGIDPEVMPRPRFVIPFQVVTWGLTTALIGLSLWARFSSAVAPPVFTSPATWLAATFLAYALYYFIAGIAAKDPLPLYAGSLVATLAALFGWESPAGPSATVSLGMLSAVFAGSAYWGGRVGLKMEFRTALTDSAFGAAVLVLALVLVRHVCAMGDAAAYLFHPVTLLDGIALFLAMGSFVVCSYQYGSRLPMYGAVLCLVVAAPPLAAASGFLIFTTAEIIRRRVPGDQAWHEDERLRVLGRIALPLEDRLPSLFVLPLSAGTLPLSLLGLLFSVMDVGQGSLSHAAPLFETVTTLAGASISALMLGLLTRTYRIPWLFVLSLLSGIFTVHATAQRVVFSGWSSWTDAAMGHLTVLAALSLLGLAAAGGNSLWCEALLRRIAEEKEARVRERHVFYSGMLHAVTAFAAVTSLGMLFIVTILPDKYANPTPLVATAGILTLFFGLSGAFFRSKLGSYLSLAAMSLGMITLYRTTSLPAGITGAVLAALGLLMALLSVIFFSLKQKGIGPSRHEQFFPSPWEHPPLSMAAMGLELWISPLAGYALLAGSLAFLHAILIHAIGGWNVQPTAPFLATLGLTPLILFFCTWVYRMERLYALAIVTGYLFLHVAVPPWFDRTIPSDKAALHVFIAATTSLMGWGYALAISAWCNRCLKLVSGDREEAAVRERQTFYAGVLQQVTKVAATLAVILLIVITFTAYHNGRNISPLRLAAGPVLAVFFGLSATACRSRALSYLSLTATCLPLYGLIGIFAPSGQRGSLNGLALSVLALIFGLASWRLSKRIRSPRLKALEMTAGPDAFGLQPPHLPPAYAIDSFWEITLAQVSVLLGFGALLHVMSGWEGNAEPVLALGTLFLTVAVWLLGTATRWTEIFYPQAGLTQGNIYRPFTLDATTPDYQARTGLYILAIVTGCLALHATVHTYFILSFTRADSLAWHTLLAAVLSLAGGAIAVCLSTRSNSLLVTAPEEAAELICYRRAFYAGLLHHTSLAVASLDFLVLLVLSASKTFRSTSLPFLATGLVLSVFFGLAGAVYASRVGSYLALLSLGLSAMQVAAFIPWLGHKGGAADAAFLSFIALLLIVLRTILWHKEDETSEAEPGKSLLPSPWSGSPLPLGGKTLRELWAAPLSKIALFFGGLALALVALRWNRHEEWQIMAVYCQCAAICVLAARLHKHPIFTYIATGLLWAGVYSLPTVPYVHYGTTIVILSLALWGAGFLAERRAQTFIRTGTREETAGRVADLMTVFALPLGRCAGILAVIAMAHSLAYWRLVGLEKAGYPVMAACAGGTFSLLLAARSLMVTRQVGLGRLYVYLACAALAGGSLTGAARVWGPSALAPALAAVSLMLGFAGLILLERAEAARSSDGPGEEKCVYGEPMSNAALLLTVPAVLLALAHLLPSGIAGIVQPADTLARLREAQLGPLAATLLINSFVCLVSLRARHEPFWLYPSVILATSGIMVVLESTLHLSAGLFVLATALLMNLLVAASRLMERNRDRVTLLLRISEGFEKPFHLWPAVVTAAIILGQGTFFCLVFLGLASPGRPAWPWLLTPLLASTLFLHLFCVKRHLFHLHVLVASSLLGCLGAAASSSWALAPELTVTALGLLWGFVAAGFESQAGDGVLRKLGLHTKVIHSERAAMGKWSVGLLSFALVLAVLSWIWLKPGFPNTGVTFLLVASGFAVGGCRWRRPELTVAAALLVPAGISAIVAFFRPPSTHLGIMPFAGFVAIVLVPLYLTVSHRLRPQSGTGEADVFLARTKRLLAHVSQGFTIVAAASAVMSALLLPPSPLVAITLGLVSVCWLYMTWSLKQETIFYLAEAALYGAFAYVRHRLLGLPSGPDVVKSFGVIGLSFFMFGLNVVVARGRAWAAEVFIRPTYYSAVFLPLFLFAVTPMGDRWSLSLVIFAAATLYLLISRLAHARWALYVAAVLINAALYLWVPAVHATTGLLQLYVIPAALTVLIFTHLHRGDLNRQAMTGIRLAASAAILSVSTFEMFTSDSLLHFMVVLAMSLLLAVVGVMLRIRPFVYIGSSFLMVNVLAQLGMRLHSQGGIVRAVILIAVGFSVLGAMIFFNTKREFLLRRYRLFMSDTDWE